MNCYMFIWIITYLEMIQEGNSHPTPSRGDFTVEEYYIEHQITGSQAKNASNYLKINADEITSPGCQTCTDKEMRYCLGQQLVNDHCCCDKRYVEYFPYVPHTCYLGPKLCKTIAQDCTEYARLRTCCCNRSVLEKWKGISNTSQPQKSTAFCVLTITMHLVLYLVTS